MLDGPICDSDPYPRYEPGDYEVRCLEAKIYPDPRFRRLVCRLGPGPKPQAGRGSKYWRAWVIANGEMPKKRQVLSVRVFVGKIFLVRIGDVAKRLDGNEHAEFEKYSVIQEIISRRWP